MLDRNESGNWQRQHSAKAVAGDHTATTIQENDPMSGIQNDLFVEALLIHTTTAVMNMAGHGHIEAAARKMRMSIAAEMKMSMGVAIEVTVEVKYTNAPMLERVLLQ
jgi:hypothetical protein